MFETTTYLWTPKPMKNEGFGPQNMDPKRLKMKETWVPMVVMHCDPMAWRGATQDLQALPFDQSRDAFTVRSVTRLIGLLKATLGFGEGRDGFGQEIFWGQQKMDVSENRGTPKSSSGPI